MERSELFLLPSWFNISEYISKCYVPVGWHELTQFDVNGFKHYCIISTVFPSNANISTRLPDSASIFTAEIWAIIKALKEKQIVESKYIVFTDSISFPPAYAFQGHKKLGYPLIGMVIRKRVF